MVHGSQFASTRIVQNTVPPSAPLSPSKFNRKVTVNTDSPSSPELKLKTAASRADLAASKKEGGSMKSRGFAEREHDLRGSATSILEALDFHGALSRDHRIHPRRHDRTWRG